MSIQCSHPKLDKMCECGHARWAHADAFQKCDDCDCKTYRGEIDEIPMPNYYGIQSVYPGGPLD